MHKNDMTKQLMEMITSFVSLENEVIKLYCLVSNSTSEFSAQYLKEKIGGILNGYPIIIHPSLYEMYLQVVNLIDKNKTQKEK